jgi:energy-coupling factor transport system permease protein
MPEEKINLLASSIERPGETDIPQNLTLQDKLKIILAFLLVVSTVFWRTFAAYTILILLALSLAVLSGKAVADIIKRLSRFAWVIVFSFFLPVLFSHGGTVLWHWKWITVSETGILQGVLFALRLVFLICISIWIGITDPQKLSRELAWILSPLRYFHFSVDRIPKITSLSMSFVPVIWEKLSHVKPKKLKSVLDVLVTFFVGLENSSQ